LWHWATEKHEDGELKHPDFFNAYMRAKDYQESLLIEGGMSGHYQSQFAQLAAKNLIGWRDKSDVAQETTLIAPTLDQLDSFYNERIKRSRELDSKADDRDARIADWAKGNG
jgi:hypothetical protein